MNTCLFSLPLVLELRSLIPFSSQALFEVLLRTRDPISPQINKNPKPTRWRASVEKRLWTTCVSRCRDSTKTRIKRLRGWDRLCVWASVHMFYSLLGWPEIHQFLKKSSIVQLLSSCVLRLKEKRFPVTHRWLSTRSPLSLYELQKRQNSIYPQHTHVHKYTREKTYASRLLDLLPSRYLCVCFVALVIYSSRVFDPRNFWFMSKQLEICLNYKLSQSC